MKPVNWIIQKNLINNKTFAGLKKAILFDQAEYQEVYIVPFSDELPFELNDDYHNVLYGTTTLIMNAARNQAYRVHDLSPS